MDGITMGHPCCNERDCKEPLRKVYDEYCPLHENLGVFCCVNDCKLPREVGFRTCTNTAHRGEELRRQAGSRKTRGVGRPYSKGLVLDRAAQNKRPKGVFSRRWTHNEQLMVRPCGVIIGRATFYSSESLSGVKVIAFAVCDCDYVLNSLRRLSWIASSPLTYQAVRRISCSSTLRVGSADI